MIIKFNRNPLIKSGSIEAPDTLEIKNTPTLWNASLDDAIKYGGDLTRAALSAMNLRGDKKHIIVDTKVHMLAPGQSPALPGWHTDGTPRTASDKLNSMFMPALESLHPQNKGLPVIIAQEHLDSPRFHLLVTGDGCLTQFIDGPIDLKVPKLPSRSLYSEITQQTRQKVADGDLEAFDMPSCSVVEWDWWALHQAQIAKKVEWRYLIRVTESDHNEPQTDLRQILRTQNQVYAPLDAGW